MLTNESIRAYFKTNPERPTQELANVKLLPIYAQNIVQFYAAQPDVRTVMTIGSISAKKDDEFSDIDLVLICENTGIPSPEDRIAVINYVSDNKATLDSIDLKIWNFGTADDFTIAKQEVCTQFFTKAYIEEKVDLTVNGFYNQVGMEHPLASLSSLLNATVHIDKDGFYRQLLAKIDPYPTKLRKLIIDQELGMRLPYYLNRFEVAMARGDIPFAGKMIQQAIDAAVYVIFAQQKRFPNGPKRLFQQLHEVLPTERATQLEECIRALYEDGANPQKLKQQQERLQTLFATLKGAA